MICMKSNISFFLSSTSISLSLSHLSFSHGMLDAFWICIQIYHNSYTITFLFKKEKTASLDKITIKMHIYSWYMNETVRKTTHFKRIHENMQMPMQNWKFQIQIWLKITEFIKYVELAKIIIRHDEIRITGASLPFITFNWI